MIKFEGSVLLKTMLLLFGLAIYFNTIVAQRYQLSNTFNLSNGLPSNHIYDIIQDNQGFLWIATDNGLSRFDGKYFQTFTVREGLPSNEVIQLRKSKDGTIWVNCFRQAPAYFDEIKNMFISFSDNKIVKAQTNGIFLIHNWDEDTIHFVNGSGTLCFYSKKLVSYNKNNDILIPVAKQTVYLRPEFSQMNKSTHSVFSFFAREKKIGQLSNSFQSSTYLQYQGEVFFIARGAKILRRMHQFKLNPFQVKIDSLVGNAIIQSFIPSKHELNLVYDDTFVEIFDLVQNKSIIKIENIVGANCIFKDKCQNVWIGTTDKGLYQYTKGNIKIKEVPKSIIDRNFLSIEHVNGKKLFAGNYTGEVLEITPKKFLKHKLTKNNEVSWIRKILQVGNHIVAMDDHKYHVDFKKSHSIYNEINLEQGLKSALMLNDSMLVVSTVQGLYDLNINTHKYHKLTAVSERIFDMTISNKEEIYYITQNGINKLNLMSKNTQLIQQLKFDIRETPLNILAFDSNQICIATSIGNLIFLKNDQKYNVINKQEGLPDIITKMIYVDNSIWLASKSGICIISLEERNGNKVHNLTTADGLPSNIVNDLVVNGDSIFIATENGICSVPKNIELKQSNIAPQLIQIKMNQRKLEIRSKYLLKSNQNNLLLTFAGVDLTGHFKSFQYAIDDTLKWTEMEGNNLNIQLNNGLHSVYVTAMDLNNQISTQKLKLEFLIETPFYKATWFFVALAILFTGFLFWVHNFRKQNELKIKLNQQVALEHQRNKITADLHDDIGATLSSLQLNSAVAQRLLHTNIERTGVILSKIENQSHQLADKIGDIIWSMKPGKDEFMTISNRIKNFANESLASIDIHYDVNINVAIDKLMVDVTMRKNVLLICKEAINNIAKYSRATKVEIEITAHQQLLKIVVSDNGIGFDSQQPVGNGLENMKRRAKELNGRFVLHSNIGRGTTIDIQIPLIP